MSQNPQNGLQCGQFEALLAGILDTPGLGDAGGLTPEQARAFEAHRLICPVCGPMFADVKQGMSLLRALPEVEPPKNLTHNILARTSGAEAVVTEAAGAPVRVSATQRWLRNLQHSFRGLWHSRFATSFAMAFFSLSLTLTLAGVKITDIAKVDWRPSALRRSVVLQYTQVEARVMRYYDNMRLVYMVETRVQQLKKETSPQNNDHNRQERQNWNQGLPGGHGRPEKQESAVQEDDAPPQQAEAGFAQAPISRLAAKSTMKDEEPYYELRRACGYSGRCLLPDLREGALRKL